MEDNKVLNYIKDVLGNIPAGWSSLTTHRLDIYNEKLAKIQFLNQFESLFNDNNSEPNALAQLPTAYDYIRLGHPLSCILEWLIAKLNELDSKNVISFSSETIPILAVLRKNLLFSKNTTIIYSGELPVFFDPELVKNIYGYKFDLQHIEKEDEISDLNIDRNNTSTILFSKQNEFSKIDHYSPKKSIRDGIDFEILSYSNYGSVLLVRGEQNESYISEIQHVRRRETIAMTPDDCLSALEIMTEKSSIEIHKNNLEANKKTVLDSIKEITGTKNKPVIGSSGLSIQYAIMMGLIDDAVENHKGKDIKIIVPPNCYGGTNDQARRVAACIDNVEVVDLPVDGGNDMVQSIGIVLDKLSDEDAVPFIIAEIPTNPRVEVPDLMKLKAVLSEERLTADGEKAIDPVFILDQTFCPNVHFLGKNEILSSIRAISYASGSKFPSGGQCTAGYCVVNAKAETLLKKIDLHLKLCDNEATDLQIEILAEHLPSMKRRISDAYKNTREFVDFIEETLPTAKINFVSEELAKQGFTPSVFSLDLPTKGNSELERETYKRALNLKLINRMITEIPSESKFCVSYGQLKGCYWTIPATSTQGTTKEGDKDYIVRVALSPDMDLERHKKVFLDFVRNL